MTDVHCARFAQLDTVTLYALMRLRADVFVVEQECAYADLDGRDTEPDTWHLWTSDPTGPGAYLRLLADAERWRIGRVCTRIDVRGQGLAQRLVREALGRVGPAPVGLDAQTQLVGWYERLGFRVAGAPFVEDGIPHVAMLRPPD